MAEKAPPDFDLTTAGCVTLGLRVALVVAMLLSVGFCTLLFASQIVSQSWHDGLDRHASLLAPLLGFLRSAMDPRSLGIDVAPVVAGLICFLAWVVLASVLGGIADRQQPSRAAGGRVSQPIAVPREIPRGPVAPAATPSYASSFGGGGGSHLEQLRQIAAYKKQIENTTGPEREKLSAELAEVQARLNAQRKSLAFLAIDVVGSTKMKASQNPMIVEHAFLAFRAWADGIMKRQTVWKASWTPDGCMAAFRDVEHAVAAGQEILRELRRFNQEGHEMSVSFQIRVGVSQGEVLFADSSRMDEVSDNVIDLAGHLQKYARPDTLLMAQRDVGKLKDGKAFASTHNQVDGFDTLEWVPPPG